VTAPQLRVEGLHAPLDTPVHRLDAAVELACVVSTLFAVVVTPPRAVWAFGAYAVLVGAAVGAARLPVGVLARRMVVEVPFVLFALSLPWVGDAPHREVLFGLQVSVPGSWAAWGIVAKSTIGTALAVVLAWSTSVAELLVGLERLHVPRPLVAVAGFMVRYLDVVAGQLARLQVARVSRGDDPRWLWQGRALAATAGTLFVRSYERGERVHQAMLARGFDGTFPDTTARRRPAGWAPALAWPVLAWAVAAVALLR